MKSGRCFVAKVCTLSVIANMATNNQEMLYMPTPYIRRRSEYKQEAVSDCYMDVKSGITSLFVTQLTWNFS